MTEDLQAAHQPLSGRRDQKPGRECNGDLIGIFRQLTLSNVPLTRFARKPCLRDASPKQQWVAFSLLSRSGPRTYQLNRAPTP